MDSSHLKHLTLFARFANLNSMDKPTAIAQIRQACKNLAVELMRIHPAVPALGHKATQDDIYKALFEITTQVEVIKKRLSKLESGADTPEM